jgi:hypothetical protein
LFAAAGMALVVATASVIHAQQPPPPPDPQAAPDNAPPAQPEGVEVMTRGPVHEAFAEPVIRASRATPVVAQQPPAPIQEVPPDQKPDDPNAVWIPGYWAWDNDQSNFIWISGIWRVPPPGMQWTPGYWAQADNGSQWVPGFWSATDQAQANLLPEPPDPVNEAPPPQPDASSNYVPGCWVWQTTQYMWRPGFWITYQPNWTWVPACYTWTPAGYIFVDGHWDYALANRGLLFAPVQFTANIWTRPNWFYQPTYVVSDQFLLGALFVRTDVNSYYFGDYFGKTYAQAGFVPWVDFRIGNRYYDPLLSYYRWHHRDDPRWMRTLQQTYVARASGEAPRPPRTFRQQLALSAQIARAPRDRGMAAASLSVVTPINQLQNQRLQRVPESQMRQLQQHATQLRTLSQERRQLDVRLRQQGQVATQTSRPVAVNLPRTNIEHRALQGKNAPPPAPSLPRADTTIRQAGPAGQENRQVPGRGEAFPGERGMNPRGVPTQPPSNLPREERGIEPEQRPIPGQQPAPERRPAMPQERVVPGQPPPQQPMPERRPTPPQEQPGRPPMQVAPAQPPRQPMPESRQTAPPPPRNAPPPAMQPRTPPQKPPDRKPPEKPGEKKPPENPGERKPPR